MSVFCSVSITSVSGLASCVWERESHRQYGGIFQSSYSVCTRADSCSIYTYLVRKYFPHCDPNIIQYVMVTLEPIVSKIHYYLFIYLNQWQQQLVWYFISLSYPESQLVFRCLLCFYSPPLCILYKWVITCPRRHFLPIVYIYV